MRLPHALFSLCIGFGCLSSATGKDFHAPDREPFPITLQAGQGAVPPGAAELGQKLFFDPLLSGSGRTSCATCHNPEFAFATPQRTTIFDGGRLGPRNAPSLLTSQFLPRMMWDGRFGSLEDQLQGPLSPHGEMGNSLSAAAHRLAEHPFYGPKFIAVFGGPPSPATLALSIAAFEHSLTSGWSRFDRFFLRGEQNILSPIELHGFEIFTSKGHCSICHKLPRTADQGYPLFADFGYHNLGVGFGHGYFADRGLGAISHRQADIGSFRTPSLRNVAVTAPYMHDGSIDDLPSVIEFYNGGAQPNPFLSPELRPLGLSVREKAALVAFLLSLTGEEYLPAENSRIGSIDGINPRQRRD